MAYTTLTPINCEQALLDNLRQFLAAYFDGASHTLPGEVAAVFPRALLAFNDSPPTQPLWRWGEGEPVVEIRTVALPIDERMWGEGARKRFIDRLRLGCWITASHPGPGRSSAAAQTAGTLLKALLTHPGLRYELNRVGMAHVRAERPVMVASGKGSVRLVTAIVELHYSAAMP